MFKSVFSHIPIFRLSSYLCLKQVHMSWFDANLKEKLDPVNAPFGVI